LLSANKAFFQYFNIKESESLNRRITEVVPSAVAQALFEKHIRVFDSGTPMESRERVKWADGSELAFHINLFPISGANGKRRIGGHAVNLADKYAAERKLREVNDRLLLLTRATSDAIWEWDMQTGQIFRNDALMDMVGYHVGDQKGLSWWLRRIHPEDRDRVSDAVKESTDHNRQSWQEEYRFKCADGTYKHMRDKGYIVYENGLPVKMIGSAHDVSSLKEMESQLIQEKLRNQKEMSETVIRVQEMERTRIGHELHDNVNQILSTIKLFVDMLTPVNKEEKKVKEKTIEYVKMAIEDIRKLSRELVVPKLKDRGVIESISSLVDDMLFTTQLKIKFTHDLELALLSPGVQVTIFRIVQEQLKNILKHSRATKVDITLQKKEDRANLLIRDNGVGFDSSKTHRGIGLSNIIERTRFYNGTAEIVSSPGNGCLLNIDIPIPQ
jgi:PAS domain S-box-containing protein